MYFFIILHTLKKNCKIALGVKINPETHKQHEKESRGMNKTVFKNIGMIQTQPSDHQDNPRLTFVDIIKTMKL